MIIGTVRPEEAKIFDAFAGYHRFHAEDTQDEYGSLEVFWHDGGHMVVHGDDDLPLDDCRDGEVAGWYWWACFPGCLPDGEVNGPFDTSRAALLNADEWSPEFDE